MNIRKRERPADWPKSGFYWFLHHDTTVEWTDDIDERWNYVCAHKPAEELELRLRAMRPVKGKLPEIYIEARKACVEARKAAYEAGKAYEMWKAAYEAGRAYIKAGRAYIEARKACYEDIEALRIKECSDVPWNGKHIVFQAT